MKMKMTKNELIFLEFFIGMIKISGMEFNNDAIVLAWEIPGLDEEGLVINEDDNNDPEYIPSVEDEIDE